MRDIPIIFSGPMVRALLAGRKTMTRRLARIERKMRGPGSLGGGPDRIETPSPWQKVEVGDRLWVRESFRHDDFAPDDWDRIIYRADAPIAALLETKSVIKWKPSIHMPRQASRLTLIVTGTKVERLHSITDADAQAEGIVEDDGSEPDIWYVPGAAPILKIQAASRPAPVFRSLWIALHGEESWTFNPFVVALSFRVIKANIDAPEALAA